MTTRREFFAAAYSYKLALPGEPYSFPRDHFEHADYKTEWWYYTGNVSTAQGRAFGYELTFFRQAIDRTKKVDSVWAMPDVYLAHFALSDLAASRFHHLERLNRPGPGIAGASFVDRRVWNGNWQSRWDGSAWTLNAVAEFATLQLTLRPAKPPVIHGENGISQKAAGKGDASRYISFTRLDTTGRIDGHAVQGLSWMDHEYFSHSIGGELSGWDWFSLQLDNGCELMVYRLRRRDGSSSEYSSGTWIDASGRTRHLKLADFELTPGRRWKSGATGGDYPLEWRVRVPSLQIDLAIRPAMDVQELVSTNKFSPSYWEGAMRVAGSHRGVGYLEMTGYDKGVSINTEP